MGLRTGFVTGPSSLVHIKGGYSNGRYTLNYRDTDFPEDDFRVSDNLDGFHLGASGEVGLGQSAYAKLEYVYTRYGGYDYQDEITSADLDVERHQVVAGIGFRF